MLQQQELRVASYYLREMRAAASDVLGHNACGQRNSSTTAAARHRRRARERRGEVDGRFRRGEDERERARKAADL